MGFAGFYIKAATRGCGVWGLGAQRPFTVFNGLKIIKKQIDKTESVHKILADTKTQK